MANKCSKILVCRYVNGSGGFVNLIALSKADKAKHHCHKFIVQWGGEVYRGEYLDSGYSARSFSTYEKALEYFNAYR